MVYIPVPHIFQNQAHKDTLTHLHSAGDFIIIMHTARWSSGSSAGSYPAGHGFESRPCYLRVRIEGRMRTVRFLHKRPTRAPVLPGFSRRD